MGLANFRSKALVLPCHIIELKSRIPNQTLEGNVFPLHLDHRERHVYAMPIATQKMGSLKPCTAQFEE
jgi:hypothetical protein